MKNRTDTATAEELLTDLRALISEAEQVVASGVSATSSNVVADLRERLESGLEKLNEYYGGAKEKVVAGARRTDEAIRSHPYESLAIALGVGVLLGALIRRQ